MNEFDMDPREQAELDALATEMQRHLVQPELSAGFVDLLQERLQAEPWTLRAAIRRNRLLRLAASLLLITTVAGPVSALVILFTQPESKTPVIGVDLPEPLIEVEEDIEPDFDPAVPPLDPSLEDAFGMDWHEAVEQSNRMALVIRQWNEANQDVADGGAHLAPALMDWTHATEAQIADEFRRRCQLGIVTPPPSTLAERVIELDAAGNGWAQAWQWVLSGSDLQIQPFFQR